MLTRQEAERLAQAINALRPDWPVASLLTAIHKRKDRPLLDLGLELTYVALDPDTKSPARIDQDGPWKRIANPTSPGITYPAASPTDCETCGRPYELHSRLSVMDGHEYEPRHARTSSERMPDDVRDAIAALPKPERHVEAEKPAPAPATQVIKQHTEAAV